MRVTVEIPDEKIKAIQRATGISKKSPAISKAVDEYLDMKARQSFAMQILEKRMDYDATNEEIEDADEARAKLLDRERS